MEVHHTSNPWTYLDVKRSKIKVITRPINAHTVNAQYLPNGKTYELQAWYTYGASRSALSISAMTSKVKGQGRKVTWCVWQVLAISEERKVPGTPKLVGRLTTPQAIMRSSFQIKGQRSRSPGRLMLRPEVCHIFRKERPTNFKLGTQMEYEDPYHHQAPWPPKPMVKVARSRDASDRFWPIRRDETF